MLDNLIKQNVDPYVVYHIYLNHTKSEYEILKEAPIDAQKPAKGAHVVVHYTGWLYENGKITKITLECPKCVNRNYIFPESNLSLDLTDLDSRNAFVKDNPDVCLIQERHIDI